jgi:SNF2 family DNA or RNA helicase
MLKDIKRLYHLLLEKEAERSLRELSVDVLSHYGARLPIAKLKNTRYRNIAALAGVSHKQLAQLRGIGPTTANRIKRAVENVVWENKKNLRFNLTNHLHDYQAKELLFHVRTIMEFDDVFESFKEMAESNYERWKVERKILRKARIFLFRWFMSKRQKQQIQDIIMNQQSWFSSKEHAQIKEHMERFQERSKHYDDLENHFVQHSIEYYSILEGVMEQRYVPNQEQTGLDDTLVNEIRNHEVDTSLLTSQLRSYQHFGVQYILHQKRVLLGDDMGLGKTIQTLAAMAHLQTNGHHHFLVIVPLTVLINWKREVAKHTTMTSYTLYGKELMEGLEGWIAFGGVAVATYESIQQISSNSLPTIDLIALDEAHYIKNPSANRSRESYRLIQKSKYVVLLTGTPLENRLEEMVTLIQQIDSSLGYQLQSSMYIMKTEQFQHAVAPVYLRRTRDEVLSELPDLTIMNDWVSFSEKEYQQYRVALQRRDFHYLRRIAWMTSHSSKLERLVDICDEALENGKKVVIFSFYLDVISKLYQTFEAHAVEPITGSVGSLQRQAILDEFEATTSKHILISQITTGGHGINLQFANIVVLCEPQFKPSTESQAIARVHRMGQTNNVLVYRLLTERSIDEYILSILDRKEKIFDAYAESSILHQLEQQTGGKLEEYILNQELQRHGVQETQTS